MNLICKKSRWMNLRKSPLMPLKTRRLHGTVTQVNPTLQTVSNYSTVQGLVTLNLDGISDPPVLFQGLTASVTLYQGKSEDTLAHPDRGPS